MRISLFAQPLIPVGATNPAENRELASLLTAYGAAVRDGERDAVQPFVQFLQDHPHSAWKPSLQVDLGAVYRRTGHFSKALETWQAAWDGSKGFTDRNGRAVADIAVAYLSQLEANYGRKETLGPLLAQLKHRPVRGSATELVTDSATGLADMLDHPEIAFLCGPSALARILALKHSPTSAKGLEVLQRARSTPHGLSLSAVQAVSVQAGMNYQMAYRSPGASMIIPAVVHWKVDHYAALLGKDRAGRFLVGDPTFGADIVVSPSTLEEEATGYYLVPPGPLPKGWRTVDASEGGKIWGRGDTGKSHDNGATGDKEIMAFPRCGGGGCATWNVEAMVTGLTLHDDPLGYNPPVGPPIHTSLTYSHRDATQPPMPPFANFGNKWNNEWLSYIETNADCGSFYGDSGNSAVFTNPQNPGGSADYVNRGFALCDQLYRRGGGLEPYTYPSDDPTKTQTSYEGQFSHSILTRSVDANGNVTGAVRQLPDGSTEKFSFPYTPSSCTRAIIQCGWLFLSEVDDPQGNAVKISYDAQLRITNLTDAIGQKTTFCYNDTWQTSPLVCKQPPSATNPPSNLQVTQITDPFGRSAFFGYDPSTGHLTSIQDVLGITSSFVYQSNSHFIQSLTTPYGTTQFEYGDALTDSTLGSTRFVQTTDPLGQISRVEFSQSNDLESCVHDNNDPNAIAYDNETGYNIICMEPANQLPSAPAVASNVYLEFRNTFIWDPYQYAQSYNSPNRYLGARVIHWLHTNCVNNCVHTASRIPESVKDPLETRIWFNYPGQSLNAWLEWPYIGVGASNQPSVIARALDDDGSMQSWQFQYNAMGRVTQATDPVGRQVTMAYATNGIDLLTITNTTEVGNKHYSDLLQTFSNYNNQHEPQSVVYANGKAATFKYNAVGQVTSRTDPLGNTWTMCYDTACSNSATGYLMKIKGPSAPQIPEYDFSYDTSGRLHSSTDPSGEIVLYSYDAGNRLTQASFPDQTSIVLGYTLLDMTSVTDRRGNQTQRKFDADRRLYEIDEPGGRATSLSYWPNGVVQTIVDPLKFQTTYSLDTQGRISQITFPDNISQTTSPNATNTTEIYKYDGTGRIIEVDWTSGNSPNHPLVCVSWQCRLASYSYNSDNTLANVWSHDGGWAGPVDGTIETFYGYDPAYLRLSSWGQSNLTTTGLNSSETYKYNPVTSPPALAANRLQKVTTVGWGFATPGAVQTYRYDELNRVVGRQLEIPQATSGSPIISSESWQYDGLGRVSNRNDDLSWFTYTYADASRRVSEITGANGFQISADYYPPTGDGLMRGLSYGIIRNNQLEALAGFKYDYDPNHNVTSFTESYPNRSGRPVPSTAYTYDAYNQLTVVQGPGAVLGNTTTYGYDLAGNLQTANSVGALDAGTGTASRSSSTTTSYGGANQITQTQTTDVVGGHSNSIARSGIYGPTGWLASLNPSSALSNTAYTYDSWDRLKSITQAPLNRPGQPLSSEAKGTLLDYDGLGRLVQITDKIGRNIVSEHSYLYCGSMRCAEYDNSTGAVSKIYLPEGYKTFNNPNQQGAFYIKDQLGTVRRVISNGTVSADYQFDPYGNRATVGGSGPDSDFGFAGYFYHAPTGLQFAQHRVYDAQLGRWLTWDPIEAGHSDLASIWTPPARQLAGSLSSRSQIPAAGSPHFNATDLNLYAYARNNPISKRDPSGYCVEDACVVEAAVIGSAISVVGPELPEIEEEGAQVLTTVEEFAAEGWQFHHIFPVQLADWFEDLFDIDVDDWTIFIPRELHALMHAEGWNPAWETWLIEAEENEYSVLDAGQFAIKLLTRYGLWDPCTASRAIVPYPYK